MAEGENRAKAYQMIYDQVVAILKKESEKWFHSERAERSLMRHLEKRVRVPLESLGQEIFNKDLSRREKEAMLLLAGGNIGTACSKITERVTKISEKRRDQWLKSFKGRIAVVRWVKQHQTFIWRNVTLPNAIREQEIQKAMFNDLDEKTQMYFLLSTKKDRTQIDKMLYKILEKESAEEWIKAIDQRITRTGKFNFGRLLGRENTQKMLGILLKELSSAITKQMMLVTQGGDVKKAKDELSGRTKGLQKKEQEWQEEQASKAIIQTVPSRIIKGKQGPLALIKTRIDLDQVEGVGFSGVPLAEVKERTQQWQRELAVVKAMEQAL